jgi:hypothetical protein
VLGRMSSGGTIKALDLSNDQVRKKTRFVLFLLGGCTCQYSGRFKMLTFFSLCLYLSPPLSLFLPCRNLIGLMKWRVSLHVAVVCLSGVYLVCG